MGMLYLLLIWLGFIGIFISESHWILPSSLVAKLRIVDEIIFLLLISKIMLNYDTHAKYLTKSTRLFAVVLFFIIYFSSTINEVSPLVSFEFFIRYGKSLIIFIYCQMFFKNLNHTISRFVKYLRIFIIIQFIINLLWYFGITLIPNSILSDKSDWALGTLGNVFIVAILTAIVLTGSLYRLFFIKRTLKSLFMEIIFFSICLIQLIWVDTRHLFFVIPAIILFQIFTISGILTRPKFIFSIILILFFSSSAIRPIKNFLLDNYLTGIYMLSISPKGLSYYHSFISIPNHVRLSLIGAGPGKAGSFIGKEHQAFLTKKYFMKYDIPQFRMGNSIMTLPYTGINTIQSELGYLGTILFFITIFFVIWRLIKINRANFNHKKYFVIGEVDFMAYFCVLFFVAENILADYLQQSLFPLIVWILISFSYFFDSKYYNRKKHRLKMNLT